jgi:hypothetical protein
LLQLVLLTGCTSHVTHAKNLYADGRYIEAAEVFERTEYRVGELSPSDRAGYGLYRGLTLLALGDIRHAHRWLSFAYEVERSHPGALGSNRHDVLERAWTEVLNKSQTPPAPTPSNTAVAASLPPSEPSDAAGAPPQSTPPLTPTRRSLVGQ